MIRLKGIDAQQRAEALQRLIPGYPHVSVVTHTSYARRYALAAGIALAAVGAAYLTQQLRARDAPFERVYTTAKMQNRAFSLPDGTEVKLGADSILRVSYTNTARIAELRRGEVFFDIEPDAQRVFWVDAGSWRLTDIGTAFNVRRTADQLVVAVAQGIVDVANPSVAPSSPPLRIVAGEQAVMTASTAPQVAKVGVDSVASWQRGQLRFQDESLSVVVANLNRYAQRDIVLGDPRIAAMRFSGTVLTDNLDGWLEATCRVFSLRQIRDDERGIVLHLE